MRSIKSIYHQLIFVWPWSGIAVRKAPVFRAKCCLPFDDDDEEESETKHESKRNHKGDVQRQRALTFPFFLTFVYKSFQILTFS